MGYITELTTDNLTGVHAPNITGDRAVNMKHIVHAYMERGKMITEQKNCNSTRVIDEFVLKVRNVRDMKY